MKRQLFSTLLAAFLLASSFTALGTNALAQESPLDEQAVLEEAEKFVSVMQSHPALFGLSAAYRGELYLGQPIPAYQTYDTGLEEISAVKYYPVLDSTNSPIVILLISQDAQGDIHITSDVSLVQGMTKQNHLMLNTGLTFIFDDSQGYVKAGHVVTPILQIQSGAEEHRTPLTSSHLTADTLEQAELKAAYRLHTATPFAPSSTRATGQYYIDLPCYKQLLKNSCWAACTRSVGEYYTPHNIWSEADIYDVCGIPYNDDNGGGLPDVSYALSQLYGYGGNILPFHGSMKFSTVGEYISAGRPLVGSVDASGSSDIGHAVAIRGYYQDTDFGIFTFMDPATGTYRGTNVTSDKQYYYTSPDGVTSTIINVFIGVRP